MGNGIFKTGQRWLEERLSEVEESVESLERRMRLIREVTDQQSIALEKLLSLAESVNNKAEKSLGNLRELAMDSDSRLFDLIATLRDRHDALELRNQVLEREVETLKHQVGQLSPRN